jgi:hypothetical protein
MDAEYIFMHNIPETIAVMGLAIYFFVIGIMYIFAPKKHAPMFSISPVGNAGVTEIRVYYGSISWALCFFLVFLFAKGLGEYALIGGLAFSNFVFFTRFIFTFVDKAWKDKYTKLAIPCELAFIVLLWLMFALSKTLY